MKCANNHKSWVVILLLSLLFGLPLQAQQVKRLKVLPIPANASGATNAAFPGYAVENHLLTEEVGLRIDGLLANPDPTKSGLRIQAVSSAPVANLSKLSIPGGGTPSITVYEDRKILNARIDKVNGDLFTDTTGTAYADVFFPVVDGRTYTILATTRYGGSVPGIFNDYHLVWQIDNQVTSVRMNHETAPSNSTPYDNAQYNPYVDGDQRAVTFLYDSRPAGPLVFADGTGGKPRSEWGGSGLSRATNYGSKLRNVSIKMRHEE